MASVHHQAITKERQPLKIYQVVEAELQQRPNHQAKHHQRDQQAHLLRAKLQDADLRAKALNALARTGLFS